jgi:tetratricopeptide (TPR) repeat protein
MHLIVRTLLLVTLFAAGPASAAECPPMKAPPIKFAVKPSEVRQDLSLKRSAIETKAVLANARIIGGSILYYFYYTEIGVEYEASLTRSRLDGDICSSPDGIFVELRLDRIVYVPSEIAGDPCVVKTIVDKAMLHLPPEENALGTFAASAPGTYAAVFADIKSGRGPNTPAADQQVKDQITAIIREHIMPDLQQVHRKLLATQDLSIPADHCDGRVTAALRKLRQASNDRAEPYKDADHVVEAEPRLKRALAMDEKTLGPEHPVVVADLNNLAVAYQRQGRLAEAESVLKRALAISEKTRGPGYPELSTTLDNLANVYQDQGRLAEAESLFKRALAIDEKALGPEHRSVALKLNNLAMLYNDEGRRAEAVALLKRALAIDEKTLGLEHPTTRAIRDNLRVISDTQAAHPN